MWPTGCCCPKSSKNNCSASQLQTMAYTKQQKVTLFTKIGTKLEKVNFSLILPHVKATHPFKIVLGEANVLAGSM